MALLQAVRQGLKRSRASSKGPFRNYQCQSQYGSSQVDSVSLDSVRVLSSRHFATSTRREEPVIIPPEPQPVNWAARSLMILATSAGLGLAAAYAYFGRPPIEANKGPVVSPPSKTLKGTVGGPFKLVNQDGKVVTDQDFLGKWVLIYFGYTHCPEDCPKQLQKVAGVVNQIEATAGQEVVPIFISIDPDRDNINQVKQYVKEFHPRLVGLTGTPSDIRPVLWRYRIYFKKTEEDGSDYLVEHSSNIYLMNTNMECVKSFGPEYDVNALVDAINKEMRRIQERRKSACLRGRLKF